MIKKKSFLSIFSSFFIIFFSVRKFDDIVQEIKQELQEARDNDAPSRSSDAYGDYENSAC